MGQIGVFQAQRMIAPAGAVHAVGQAAGLGAAPPVAAALADEGAHGALAGVAHAQRPVDEGLHLGVAAPADFTDFLAGQLPGQHHPADAERGRHPCAAQRVEAHLGAGVKGHIGGNFTGQVPHAPVLYQHGVHAHGAGLSQGLRRLGQLPVGDQGVQREIHLHAPQVAVGHGIGKFLIGKVPGALAGVEGAEAHIHRVRPGLHRRLQGLPGPGGCQKLGHYRLPCCCCSLKIWRFNSLTSFLAALASSR